MPKAERARGIPLHPMNRSFVKPEDSGYPTTALKTLQHQPTIATIGNLDLLRCRPLALFCSVKCPGDVIVRTYDLIRSLRGAEVPMIGGFHSPMEKECLRLLLRGTQPIIVCPPRAIDRMRIPPEWKQPLDDNRLLVLSPFEPKSRRATAEKAHLRNLFVAALADQILVVHAGAGSKTESLVHEFTSWGKAIWTIPCTENENLLASGLRPLLPDTVGSLLK